MKHLLLSISAVFLFSCCFAQSKELNEDSCLRKLGAVLPAGWQLKVSNNWVLVQSRDSAWVAKNRDSKLSPAEIKKQGDIKPLSFMFRSEARWSEQKIQEGKQRNDSIWKQINDLKVKYKVENLNTAGGSDNKEEADRINAYNGEVTVLKKKLVELPVFNTEKWSLFDTFFNEKISNEIYYPTSAGNEMMKVHGAIRQSLISTGAN